VISSGRLWGVVRDNPGFRRLCAANAVSQLGDWLNVVALFSLLIELTGKGESVALVLVTRLLPAFFVGPAAGVLADRISRRAILVVCDLTRAGLVLCLLFVRKPEHAPLAYGVMALHSLASAFFEPAQAALVPNLVPRQDLLVAVTLENSLWSAALALGAALGGAVLALAGRDAAFVLDAASFIASALFLRGLPELRAKADRAALQIDEEARGPEAVGGANLLGLRDLREGARYVAGNADVRALLIVKASFGFTLGGVLVLLAFFGEKVFALAGGTGIALLWTARGLGSLAGPFVAWRMGGESEPALRRGIAAANATILVSYLAFSLSPSIWPAALALAVANAGGSILWTHGSTLLQLIVPDHVRGRVAAAEMGGMTLAMSLSTLVVGRLIDRGVQPRALMAGCGLIAALPLAFWVLRKRSPAAERS